MKFHAAAVAAVLLASPALAQPVASREVGTLVMENVPETPPALRESLRRYQNARSTVFRDWLADGSMLITTRFGQTAQLHRVAAPLGVRSQLTFYDEPISGAVAQPGTAERFVFSRDTGGDEYFQLYAADLAGSEVQISEPKTRNTGPLYSRDGRWIAWTRVTPGSGDYDVLVMDAADPASRRVVHEGTGAISPIAFSPDGSKLLLGRYNSVQSSKRYLLDIASGALTEINPSKAEIAYDGGAFTPDGRAVLMISDEGSDVGKLVRYDLASGAKSVVADGGRWEVEFFDLPDDGSILAYAINEDGRSRVVLAPFGGAMDLAQPQLPTGVLSALKFTPDGRRLAIGLNAATSPSDVWVWNVATAKLTRWTESELGGMDRAGMVEPTLARFRSFDRREIPAWVYRPKGAVGKAPVIVDIHGGPEGQSRPGFSPTYQYWARELGAAVVVPNVRGSTGYGKAYVALDNGARRQDSVKDIGALLDWIATQPDLDASRVVVSGGSYGGFMSLASLAAYSDRLAGAVESVGISDFETFLKNTEGYRRDLRRAEYGDERDPAMQKVFRQISPIHLTARMKKPLFVSAGFNDPRVPWTEGQQIVRAVRAGGGEVWWMMAKDEGHGFAKKHNRDALREAETLFLKKVFGLP